MVRPQIGEKIYDPFCGTGGMLVVAFKHLMDTMPHNAGNLDRLRRHTVYGADLTKAASIAKMNMILAGDGHNNIHRRDSLANPIDNKYDIVLTNMPFSQGTQYGDKYEIPSRNGDIICPQNCFRSLTHGGRMAIIVPEGFLSRTNEKAYTAVRQYLVDNASLEKVVSLPRGAFLPYNKAKADILYFTNAKMTQTTSHYWFFYVKNDGYTLDTWRRRIPGSNDLHVLLSENDLDKQSVEYAAALGFTRINVDAIRDNNYIFNASRYRGQAASRGCPSIRLGDILEPSGTDKVGVEQDIPIMSMTMDRGLIDQGEKFKKRVASPDISKYKKVYRGELVVGFPIDEGTLGFQLKYNFAAVSPAYDVWKVKRSDIDLWFLDILFRSTAMREIYDERQESPVDRRRKIDKDIFLSIEVPIPPPEIRAAVVRKQQDVENAVRLAKDIKREIDVEISGLVTGELDEDEYDAAVASGRLRALAIDGERTVRGERLDGKFEGWLSPQNG